MRKGLSSVVVMVLLILFVLIAIGILWWYISAFVRGSSSAYDTSSCLTVDLKAVDCVYTYVPSREEYSLTVLLKRGTDNILLTNANLILTDATQHTKSISWNGSERRLGANVPGTLEQSLAAFAITEFSPITVAAAPVVGTSHVCAPSQSPITCVPYSYRVGDGCGDFNRDGNIDFFDYLDYISCYATEMQTRGACINADINHDDETTLADYNLFIAAFAAEDFGTCNA